MTEQYSTPAGPGPVDPGLVTYTHVIYALHALSAAIGILGAASIVGSFVFGVPSIVAVIMNYARRSDVRGTWLDSHFGWQIRTFWYALLMATIVFLLSLPLMIVFVGFFTAAIGIFVIGLWIVYRVARGWLALNDRRPVGA
ncbi:MAG: hypothetical protein MUC71_01855 [Steroidobacteraceae bacterium]|jgi:uncharacterized membrane protein|nr:hypothetical protein [Steroidobacteraceae bacterium]